jgi:probable rRNA maturation factor
MSAQSTAASASNAAASAPRTAASASNPATTTSNRATSASNPAASASHQSHDREGVVSVIFRRIPTDVPQRAVERFARKLQNKVAHGRPFDCLITGDAELRRLNQKFRAKDQATDVLSFPSGTALPAGSSPSGTASLGSIAISLQRARAQARAFGHSTEDEIRILMLHGILHLTGLDHETDAGRMARAEKRWRTRLGLPASLIERALVERVYA